MSVNRPVFLALRAVLKTLLKGPFHLFKGFRIVHPERLPRRRERLIVACNHAAFIDSVYLILAFAPRFTICGAKPRLFRSFWLRTAMALANILKVESHEGFLADARALLTAGEMLLIYPEMGRFPDGLGELETWAAEVALANDVAILPCYLYGTTRGHAGPPRLTVGERLAPEGDATTLTRRLRAAILALSPSPEATAAEVA